MKITYLFIFLIILIRQGTESQNSDANSEHADRNSGSLRKKGNFIIRDINEDEVDNLNLPSDVAVSDMKEGRILSGKLEKRQSRQSQAVELRTSQGIIMGTVESSDGTPDSAQGRIFYAFRGIPFAKPPIGSLRWADPVHITGEFPGGSIDASRFKEFCPQYDHNQKKVVGNEDCLYLNVFTPKLTGLSGGSKLPVLFFIHGGAYTRGASSPHGPEFLMRDDIVLVTTNYRLGVLGLLSTNDPEMPGNYAALDQVAAMSWVRLHIRDYGGDPEAVTLAGFSAGASYVHLHMLSPRSMGLFHKAIIASGAGNCLWSVQSDPWTVAEELGRDLGCPVSSSSALKQCLLLKSTETLINAQTKRTKFVYWPLQIRPNIDNGLRTEPFLPDNVYNLQRSPQRSMVPVLIGATPEEGILFALTVLLFSSESSTPGTIFDDSSRYLFSILWNNETSRKVVVDSLQSFYYSDEARKDINVLFSEMTDALTDLLFMSCVWDAAADMAKSNAPVYTYLMTHHDSGSPSFGRPLYELARGKGVTSPLLEHGVSHGDDIALIFNFPYELGSMSSRDVMMSRILTSTWASFVKNGVPHQNSRGEPGGSNWRPIAEGEPVHYFRLSLSGGMITKPYKNKERNFWQQTLPLVDEMGIIMASSYWWQISTWVFLTLLIFTIILFILSTIFLYRRSQERKYSTYYARKTPRNATVKEMREKNDNSLSI